MLRSKRLIAALAIAGFAAYSYAERHTLSNYLCRNMGVSLDGGDSCYFYDARLRYLAFGLWALAALALASRWAKRKPMQPQ